MKKFFAAIVMFLVLVIAVPAMAITLAWDNDPSYANGATILGTKYTLSTVIEVKQKADPETAWVVLATVPDYGAQYAFTLPNATYTRGMTLQFRAKAKIPGLNEKGELVTLESVAYSNVIDYTIPSLAPTAPRDLSITLQLGNLQNATIVFKKKAGLSWSAN